MRRQVVALFVIGVAVLLAAPMLIALADEWTGEEAQGSAQVRAALTWTKQSVDTAGDVGKYTSLALDSKGHPHIAYFDVTNGDVKYAYYDGTSWHKQMIEHTGTEMRDQFVSIDLTSTDLPAISYVSSAYALKYAWSNGSSWQTTVVDPSRSYYYTSLRFGKDNRPRIAYWRGYPDGDYYAWYDGTNWQTTKVDSGYAGNVGEYVSLALDGQNVPQIVSENWDNGTTYYARLVGSTWQITRDAIPSGSGRYASLELTSGGQPRLSFRDKYAAGLGYGYYDGSAWQRETVETGSGGLGEYTSLELNGSGNPCISYAGGYSAGLKYAYKDASGWHKEVVEYATGVGQYTSLALDAAGQPHITYYDSVDKDLKYAVGQGAPPTATATPTVTPTRSPTSTPTRTPAPTPAHKAYLPRVER